VEARLKGAKKAGPTRERPQVILGPLAFQWGVFALMSAEPEGVALVVVGFGQQLVASAVGNGNESP
jgi:hypothetical protein